MIRKAFLQKIRPVFVLAGFLAISGSGLAQEPTVETKVDSVLQLQKEMMKKQDSIFVEVKFVDPLKNKKFGIEFSPIALIAASASDQLTLRGGFSLFAVDRHAEIAFPISYNNPSAEDEPTTLAISAHYRRFTGEHQGGFYFSGALRYAIVSGKEASDAGSLNFGRSTLNFSQSTEKSITVHRFGVGFGIGWRRFWKSGFYWGASITLGRYFTGLDQEVAKENNFNSGLWAEAEFFKIGFAF